MKKIKTVHSGTADLKQRIIRVSLSCFIENGYAATSIGDICKKSDISVGSLYHHFKSKEQLARTVYLEGIKNYQNEFISGLNNCSTAKAGVFYIVKYHLNWISENSDWARFLLLYRHAEFMTETENDFLILNNEFYNSVGEWFKNQSKAGKIRHMPFDVYFCLLLGPCQEYSRLYLFSKPLTDIEKAGSSIASTIWEALHT